MSLIHGNPTNQVKLEHLDEYSLLGILDYLDFDELVNLADTNQEFRQFIAEHYMIPKYRIHEKQIIMPYVLEDLSGISITVKSRTFLSLLRSFGHLIRDLKFSGLFSRTRCNKIYTFIEQYCSNTLVEFELEAPDFITFSPNQPFKKVTKLLLENSYQVDFSVIDLVFPAVKELTVLSFQPINPQLSRFFSNLEHLHLVEIFWDNYAGIEDGIRKFVQTNPQLRTLRLERVPSNELLKYIRDTSKHLESLVIGYSSNVMSAYSEKINFEHIKKLKVKSVKSSEQESNSMITFQQLESIEIDSFEELLVPIALIRQQNSQLKSITFTNFEGNVSDILAESGPFEALEEVKLSWDSEKDMGRLLNDFETLKKITFVWNQSRTQPLVLEPINQILQANWRISSHNLVERPAFNVYDVVITRD